MDWNIDKSSELYGVQSWGSDFFGINSNGNVGLSIKGTSTNTLDLYKLVLDLQERGIRAPILLRFPDIIRKRIELLNNCFITAIDEYGYKGHYQGVYPIKVNQQRHIVDEIIEYGRPYKLGLECGSKPELLIGLAALDTDGALIICNGFKDVEYIETALLSQKLGKNTVIVVDRYAELPMIVAAARKLKVSPRIGFRVKLKSQGGGKWIDSAGSKSKFGLTPSEVVTGLKILEDEGLTECLELIHFHIGSQIPSIQSLKGSLKEAARFYSELHKLGATPKFIDVGGGLGIDYDGSGKSDSSTNYSEQEYANDVVSIVQQICDDQNVPHPILVSESGRALVAHSSMLIFDVLGKNQVSKTDLMFEVSEEDSALVRELYEMYNSLDTHNINEINNDLTEKKEETLQMFTFGTLDLTQRAKAEDIYWAIATKLYFLAKENQEFEDLFWELEKELSDTYYCNFSVFQSLPDSWALGQVFPVMPIHRLQECPTRRATLVDLTCDSDGKIKQFIDTDSDKPQGYLEVHKLFEGKPYFIGVFLTGAYQEILGDLHNLFGDTDTVHVSLEDGGYKIDHVVQGDCVSEILSYLEYYKPELVERIRKAAELSIGRGQLTHKEARLLMKHYEEGLAGYTYLEEFE